MALPDLAGRFVILDRGEIHTFTRVSEIPAEIDTVIEFLPDIPPGPHTDEEHEFIDAIPEAFQAIMRRSRARTACD